MVKWWIYTYMNESTSMYVCVYVFLICSLIFRSMRCEFVDRKIRLILQGRPLWTYASNHTAAVKMGEPVCTNHNSYTRVEDIVWYISRITKYTFITWSWPFPNEHKAQTHLFKMAWTRTEAERWWWFSLQMRMWIFLTWLHSYKTEPPLPGWWLCVRKLQLSNQIIYTPGN